MVWRVPVRVMVSVMAVCCLPSCSFCQPKQIVPIGFSILLSPPGPAIPVMAIAILLTLSGGIMSILRLLCEVCSRGVVRQFVFFCRADVVGDKFANLVAVAICAAVGSSISTAIAALSANFKPPKNNAYCPPLRHTTLSLMPFSFMMSALVLCEISPPRSELFVLAAIRTRRQYLMHPLVFPSGNPFRFRQTVDGNCNFPRK